jgi:hypothetical protein
LLVSWATAMQTENAVAANTNSAAFLFIGSTIMDSTPFWRPESAAWR